MDPALTWSPSMVIVSSALLHFQQRQRIMQTSGWPAQILRMHVLQLL